MTGKKKDNKRQCDQGIVVTLEETGKNNLSLILDIVTRAGDTDPAQWVFEKELVSHEYPADLMKNLKLTRGELAEIGETLMIMLMSRTGRLRD